jgi:O-antigen/teichoic acid export membrane protein
MSSDPVAATSTQGRLSSLTPTLRRLGGYAFWNASAFALPLALDRLVICPVLQRHLGKELFGALAWVLGVVYLLSLSAGAGLSNFLMRELARQTVQAGRRMLRTAISAALGIGFAAMAAGAAASLPFAGDLVRRHAWDLYAPLYVFGLAGCLQWVVLANLRIRREFRRLFVLKVIESLILLALLWAAPGRSLGLIGVVYAISVLVPVAVNIYWSRAEIGWGSWWDSDAARLMWTAYPGLVLSTLIEVSLTYAPRLALGVLRGEGEVTELVAGTAVANVFVMPVSMVGGLVLSLLAGKTTFALAGRRGHLYLGASAVVAVLTVFISDIFGRLLLSFLYPEVAPDTLKFYRWIALSNGCGAVIVLMRPVALKYARVRSVASLSSTTLLLQLALLAGLVPTSGAAGAARALAFSSLLAMTLWVGCFAVLKRRAERDQVGAEAIMPATADQTSMLQER